jgi:hypothetical protein
MSRPIARYWGQIDYWDAAHAKSIIEHGKENPLEDGGTVPVVMIDDVDILKLSSLRSSVETVTEPSTSFRRETH